MQSQTLVMAQATQFYTIAPVLAQSKMADFEWISGSELADQSGDFGEDYPGYRWQAGISDVKSEILDQIANNLKRIDITISYHDDEYKFSIRRYRFIG